MESVVAENAIIKTLEKSTCDRKKVRNYFGISNDVMIITYIILFKIKYCELQ